MVPIYGRGTHDFRNALKKLSEWNSLADLAPVLMTMPHGGGDNERISSLKRDIIGSHSSAGLLHTRARVKVYADPKWHDWGNQEQISFVIIACMFMMWPLSKESQWIFSMKVTWLAI
jgi:hypothetical protein